MENEWGESGTGFPRFEARQYAVLNMQAHRAKLPLERTRRKTGSRPNQNNGETALADFRTFTTARREPAVPMQPLIDPAGWEAGQLGPVQNWSYSLTPSDQDEVVAAVEAFRKTGLPRTEVARDNFPLNKMAGTLADVHRELTDGRGMVMLQNFPIDRLDLEGNAIGFMGLGTYLGDRMVQNRHGHVLGHVKDLGLDYHGTGRAYNTRADLRFHADSCDYVALLCLQVSKSGGESRVVSSVTVYNEILKRRPDLAKVLTEDFYRSMGVDKDKDAQPFFKQPVFNFEKGYFSAAAVGVSVDKAQKLPGVPPLTDAQKEAVVYYRNLVEELAADIPFKPGDVQILNNFVMLHSRREFEDWPEEHRRRHLLRLWIRDDDSRPIPDSIRNGRQGAGIRIKGLKPIAPLEATEVSE